PQNRFKTKTIDDEFTDLRRLKISDAQIFRRPWPLEPAIEVGDLVPTSGSKRAQKHRVPIVTPTGPCLAFFVNRQPFRKPTRNPIVGHLQSDHVRVFVPERTAPVEFAGG